MQNDFTTAACIASVDDQWKFASVDEIQWNLMQICSAKLPPLPFIVEGRNRRKEGKEKRGLQLISYILYISIHKYLRVCIIWRIGECQDCLKTSHLVKTRKHHPLIIFHSVLIPPPHHCPPPTPPHLSLRRRRCKKGSVGTHWAVSLSAVVPYPTTLISWEGKIWKTCSWKIYFSTNVLFGFPDFRLDGCLATTSPPC